MKALVTGGAGFIGFHLVDHLVSQGVNVVVVDNLSMGDLHNIKHQGEVTIYIEDVRNEKFMEQLLQEERPDYIYFLAAVASVADSIERPAETHSVNQTAVFNMLEYLRRTELPIKKFLFTSSAAVYGNLPELPKTEGSRVDPLSPYLSLPQRMTKTIEWFREHPDTAIVGTQIYEYDHDEHHPFDIKQVPIDYEHIKKESVVRNPFNHMSVTFKKSVINKVGGYIDVPLFEDYYLWLRVIRAKYPVTNLEDVLVKAHVNREFAHKRGGMHYLKKELHFQNILVRDGFLNFPQYLCNVLIRGTIRLLPPDLLLVVYKFLRKL